jgi:hypothetical protein
MGVEADRIGMRAMAWLGVAVFVAAVGLATTFGVIWDAWHRAWVWQMWTTPVWLLGLTWVVRGALVRFRRARAQGR